MEDIKNESLNPDTEIKENVAAGVLGAFLFSLAGGIIYFVLYLIGITASISGFIGVICAIKGYSIFAKRESKKGIVIAVLMSLLVIVIAWYFCLSFDIYQAAKEWYEAGEMEFLPTFSECLASAYLFLGDSDVSTYYVSNLVLGIVFCIIGGGGYVYDKLKKMKKASVNTEPTEPTENEENE